MPISGLGLSRWSSHSNKSPKTYSPRPQGSIDSVRDGFGVPSPDDPDPFGVRALELAGLAIKEAGSHSRPTSDAFDFRPSPTSPIFRLSTQSIDSVALRDARRDSKRSTVSVDHGTQTADLPSPIFKEPSHVVESPIPNSPSPSPIDDSQRPTTYNETSHATQADVPETIDEMEDEEEDDEFYEDEEPEVIIEEAKPSLQVVSATVSQGTTKAKIVSIPRRGPPALPIKNPLRQRRMHARNLAPEEIAIDGDVRDDSSSTYSSSPSKSAFDRSEYEPNPWSEQTSFQDSDSVRHKDSISDKDVLQFSDGEASRSESPYLETSHETQELPEPDQTTPVATLKKSDLASMHFTTSFDEKVDDGEAPIMDHVEDAVTKSMSNGNTPASEASKGQDIVDIDDTASVSSYYGDDEEKLESTRQDSFHSVPQTPMDPPKEMNMF